MTNLRNSYANLAPCPGATWLLPPKPHFPVSPKPQGVSRRSHSLSPRAAVALPTLNALGCTLNALTPLNPAPEAPR